MKFKKPVFYSPARGNVRPQLFDYAVKNKGGVYVGQSCGLTCDEIAVAHKCQIELGELEEVIALRESMMKSEPVEINEGQYFEMLEVLPPEGFMSDRKGQSFKMMEYFSGRITSIYASVHNRYFTFKDVADLPHDAIMAKVKAAMLALEKVPA